MKARQAAGAEADRRSNDALPVLLAGPPVAVAP
jgi:hypothetical protein